MGAGLSSALLPLPLSQDGSGAPRLAAPVLSSEETEASVLCSVLGLAKSKEETDSPCPYCWQPGALKAEIKFSKT